MTRPKPDPDNGVVVYYRAVTASVLQYEDTQIRELTEQMARKVLLLQTGLITEWEEWLFVPEETYTMENGEESTVPDHWIFQVEAAGPEGLI